MQKVIIIPGLGDHIEATQKATGNWEKFGLHPIVFRMNWYDKESFKSKLQKLCDLVDSESRDGSEVSVAGCSAGGSAALNLFVEHPNGLKKAVSVCGRLKRGNYTGFRSLEMRAKRSKSFAQSVQLFESREKSLSQDERARIMTIHSFFGDELVPADTAILEGACNIAVPTPEHSISIYMALSFFSKKLISFLKN
jgi:pimeloyl-ACP methyl ester carboxylesterase